MLHVKAKAITTKYITVTQLGIENQRFKYQLEQLADPPIKHRVAVDPSKQFLMQAKLRKQLNVRQINHHPQQLK